ncbi:MAG TPA: hypothetical protein VGE74_26950, partial [Gemmata sp.]
QRHSDPAHKRIGITQPEQRNDPDQGAANAPRTMNPAEGCGVSFFQTDGCMPRGDTFGELITGLPGTAKMIEK